MWEFLDRGLVNFLTKNSPFSNYLKGSGEYVSDQTGQSFKRKTPEEENRLALIEKKRREFYKEHEADFKKAKTLYDKEVIETKIQTQVATYSRQLEGEE